MLVSTDVSGGEAPAVAKRLDLVRHRLRGVDAAEEGAVHGVQHPIAVDRADGREGTLRHGVAAVGLRPRHRLRLRGERPIGVLGCALGQRDRAVEGGGGAHARRKPSRTESSTSSRFTTMLSGVRVVSQTSSSVVDMFASTCGMNGGTKTQSPAVMSRYSW